jgi:hypothetical protein
MKRTGSDVSESASSYTFGRRLNRANAVFVAFKRVLASFYLSKRCNNVFRNKGGTMQQM